MQELGVNKFPFIQIFRNGLCVASFSTGAIHLFNRKLQETIQICNERTDVDWNVFVQDFQDEIQTNLKVRNDIRDELLSQVKP